MALVYTSVAVRVIIACNLITFIEGMSGTYEPLYELLYKWAPYWKTIITSDLLWVSEVIERPTYNTCLRETYSQAVYMKYTSDLLLSGAIIEWPTQPSFTSDQNIDLLKRAMVYERPTQTRARRWLLNALLKTDNYERPTNSTCLWETY